MYAVSVENVSNTKRTSFGMLEFTTMTDDTSAAKEHIYAVSVERVSSLRIISTSICLHIKLNVLTFAAIVVRLINPI